jgi:hypothetical protein
MPPANHSRAVHSWAVHGRAVHGRAAMPSRRNGYYVFSSPDGSEPRQFFDHLASAGRDWFDVFDVHLYGDPRQDRAHLDAARQIMRAHGYEKPAHDAPSRSHDRHNFPEVVVSAPL